MDIFEALKKDHEELKQTLSELVSLKEDDDYRFVLIEEVRNALVPHSRAEESVFYNTLRAIDAGKSEVRHGYQEHLEAETLLRTLQLLDKMDFSWKATAKKLQEAIEHHVKEEETKIFTEARAALTEEEAVMLADAFTQLKARVSNEGALKTTMEMVINMMPPRFADKIRDIGLGSEAR